MTPVGGFAGGADAFGCAVEHQREGPPHVHGHVHLVNAYQHKTMHEIAERLKSGLLSADAVQSFHMHLCSEEYPDVQDHNDKLPVLTKAWPQFAGPEHQGLCQLPRYVIPSASKGLWCPRSTTSQEDFQRQYDASKEEGNAFCQKYSEDVQFVLSRTNHHHHKWTKKGWKPLSACMPKGKKNSMVCKHGFAKDKQMTQTAKVICKGNCMKFALRIRGKRKALGSILGRRNCPWLCGTARIMAITFRSNTNTMREAPA